LSVGLIDESPDEFKKYILSRVSYGILEALNAMRSLKGQVAKLPK